MALYDYLTTAYKAGEPIFLSDGLPGTSDMSIRQEMKHLVDTGKVERFCNGIYFLPYRTILGTRGKLSAEQVVEKKYICPKGKISGYITGFQLANLYGFTTQNPACIEVCSNMATSRQRKIDLNGRKVILYRPVAEITERNRPVLQFLDLMLNIDKYSELPTGQMQRQIEKTIQALDINFSDIKKYISEYPDRVYRNIYNGGIIHVLV
jgi:hypothetical protein